MKRLVVYSSWCAGVIAAVFVMIWALHGFIGPGLPLGALVAMVLGISLTVALAIGLMALLFYSDRSGYDESVYHGGARTTQITCDNNGVGNPKNMRNR